MLVLALSAVLALVAVAVAALFAVAVARQRAAAVADLSALAAAAALPQGAEQACARATALAGRTGGVVLSCAVAGDSVQVLVEVRPAGPVGRLGAARARARAGPVG